MNYTTGNFTVDDRVHPDCRDPGVVAASRGDLDLNQLAREALASRGVDQGGVWVGFEHAEVALATTAREEGVQG